MPASAATSEVAVFAGGCFWGVQGVFQHVKGVSNAVSGYAGGAKSTAIYELTNDGTTGHAESVQVTFDPKQMTYGQLLQVYFSVAHDPTQLNRQGPDTGTQYRSTIFPANAEQAAVAKAYIAQLDGARVQEAHRDDDRDGPRVLSRREVSPGFSRPQSHLSLHRLQRSAEDREPEAPVAGDVSSGARARVRNSVVAERERTYDKWIQANRGRDGVRDWFSVDLYGNARTDDSVADPRSGVPVLGYVAVDDEYRGVAGDVSDRVSVAEHPEPRHASVAVEARRADQKHRRRQTTTDEFEELDESQLEALKKEFERLGERRPRVSEPRS